MSLFGGFGRGTVYIEKGLIGEGVGDENIHFVPLFEGGNFYGNQELWRKDNGSVGTPTYITRQNLKAELDKLTPEQKKAQQILVTYSGSTLPALNAISSDASLLVDTIVSFAGVTHNLPLDFSGSPRFKTFVNVWGSIDDVMKNVFTGGGYIGKQEIGVGVKTYNIEILGAGHYDGWYTEEKWARKDNPAKQEINRKTYEFMLQLARAATDADDLTAFLSKFLQPDGSYKVNPDLLS